MTYTMYYTRRMIYKTCTLTQTGYTVIYKNHTLTQTGGYADHLYQTRTNDVHM